MRAMRGAVILAEWLSWHYRITRVALVAMLFAVGFLLVQAAGESHRIDRRIDERACRAFTGFTVGGAGSTPKGNAQTLYGERLLREFHCDILSKPRKG